MISLFLDMVEPLQCRSSRMADVIASLDSIQPRVLHGLDDCLLGTWKTLYSRISDGSSRSVEGDFGKVSIDSLVRSY